MTYRSVVVMATLVLATPAFAPPDDLKMTPQGFCVVMRLLSDRLANNLMVIERKFEHYLFHLPNQFHEKVQKLDGNSHWIDAGAGEARAMAGYAERLKRDGKDIPKLTALAMKRPENVPLLAEAAAGSARFRYLEGKVEDADPAKLGQADLITDLFGPFTYTDRMDLVLLSYLKLAKEGGTIVLSPSQDEPLSRDFRYPPLEMFSAPMRFVGLRNRMTLEKWFRSIEGIKVEHVGAGVALTRTGAPIKIPEMEPAFFVSTDDVPTRQVKLTGKFLTYP